jgi:hypothetical protein
MVSFSVLFALSPLPQPKICNYHWNFPASAARTSTSLQLIAAAVSIGKLIFYRASIWAHFSFVRVDAFSAGVVLSAVRRAMGAAQSSMSLKRSSPCVRTVLSL